VLRGELQRLRKIMRYPSVRFQAGRSGGAGARRSTLPDAGAWLRCHSGSIEQEGGHASHRRQVHPFDRNNFPPVQGTLSAAAHRGEA
jgi:hypothetical protein